MNDKHHLLTDVPGIGPATAQKLRDRGIDSVEDLRATVNDGYGPLLDIEGIGPQALANIEQGLERLDAGGAERIPLDVAEPIGQRACLPLEERSDVVRADLAGSVRRGASTVGDIDILIGVDDPDDVGAIFTDISEWDGVSTVLERGTKKLSVLVGASVQIDFRGAEMTHYGAALQYFTGPQEHNIALRARAKDRGLKLSEYGLFDRITEERIAAATEKEIYHALDLDYPDPSERGRDLSDLERGANP